MFNTALIFWLCLAQSLNSTFATGLFSPIKDEKNRVNSEYIRIMSDILDKLPQEKCDMIVASSWFPQGEMYLPIKQFCVQEIICSISSGGD